ncbi:hypothetical protein Tco_0113434 [Tanacetum coccineum]
MVKNSRVEKVVQDISLVHEDAGIQGRTWQIKKLMLLKRKLVLLIQLLLDISTASVPITISTTTPTTPPTTTTEDDMTLAETLMEIKSAKPKAIGVVMQEPSKAKMVEEEDNIVSWDNAQAIMEADYQMVERLQSKEQASLIDEEKASLFVQLLEARKKHFAALRAQEIRNKPPTKMQK